MKKIVSLLLALMLLVASMAFATAENSELERVDLVMYLWGNECVANQTVLDKFNEKLLADLNCTLTVKYLNWDVKDTQYPLLFMSGEQFDLAYVYASGAVNIQGLAEQGALVPMDEMLDLVPTLRDSISDEVWGATSYKGEIYAVPAMTGIYNPRGYIYRTDLSDVEVTSWETMEQYMADVKAQGMYPMNGVASDAYNLYQMFTDTHYDWIPAPGISSGSVYLVCESAENFTNISSPVYTDEFVEFCKMMQRWNEQGFWPADILAAFNSAKDNMNNGISAGFLSHMADWTGNYGTQKASLGEDVNTKWWSPAVDNAKVVNGTGAEDATGISSTSKNPERAMMVIEKLMTDYEYFMLFQYGIEGVQYEIVDGTVAQPASYDAATDEFGFCGWAFKNDEFVFPSASEDPIRYEYLADWAETAIIKPYVGFNLDTSMISNEIAAINDVNAEYGVQLLLGKAGEDVEAAVANYREMLELAGIETVINEVQTQLTAWAELNGK